MESIYYIGLDVYKKIIACFIINSNGKIICQDVVDSKRSAFRHGLTTLSDSWMGAWKTTIFSGWIYDFLKPHALDLKSPIRKYPKRLLLSKRKMTGRMLISRQK